MKAFRIFGTLFMLIIGVAVNAAGEQPLVNTWLGQDQNDVKISVGLKEVINNLGNGLGSQMKINDFISAVAENISSSRQPEINYYFDLAQDKSHTGETPWAYSSLNVDASGTNLQGLLTKIGLKQQNFNMSTNLVDNSAVALSLAIDQIILNAKLKSSDFNVNTKSEIVTAAWGGIDYNNDWGQVVSSGAEATLTAQTTYTPDLNVVIKRSLAVGASSTAQAPGANLTASGQVIVGKTIKPESGHSYQSYYRVETSASLFGGQNNHTGSASVKIIKTN